MRREMYDLETKTAADALDDLVADPLSVDVPGERVESSPLPMEMRTEAMMLKGR